MENFDLNTSSSLELPTKELRTFECPTCKLRFTRYHTLKNHLSVHVNGSIYKCSSCEKCFGRLNDKKRHEKSQHAEKKWKCRGQHQTGEFWGCGKAFARKDALGEHLRSRTGQRCRERVLNPGTGALSTVITIDLTGDESDSTARESTEPEEVIEVEPATTNQVLDSLEHRPFTQALHDEAFVGNDLETSSQLRSQVQSQLTEPLEARISPVELISMTQQTYSDFSDFLIQPLGQPSAQAQHPNFLCPICSRSISHLANFKSHLASHLSDHTTGRTPYHCPECSASFAFAITLAAHRSADRTLCGGTIEPQLRRFSRSASGALQGRPMWHWGCGRRFATHLGASQHLCAADACRRSLAAVEAWVAAYLRTLVGAGPPPEARGAAAEHRDGARLVRDREDLTRWLRTIEEPRVQAVALRVVAAKYDVPALLLGGLGLRALKQSIAADIAAELSAEGEAAGGKDAVNALWETADELTSV